MHRRTFVEIVAGTAVTVLPGFRFPSRRPERVAVVGGGILGASIAYHLARRGAEVIVLERERPAAGATGKSFAWINATFTKQPYHYHWLNRLSVLSYLQLERELEGALQVEWGGSLQWFGRPEHAARLREQVSQHQAWGYPVRLIDEDEFRQLEPNVVAGKAATAAYTEHEGTVDPVHANEVFIDAARRAGATIEYPQDVTGIDLRWGRLRGLQTARGAVAADVVVIAAGVDTPRLATMVGVGVPLKDSPGVLAHTKPANRLIHRALLSPGGHMKQMANGRVVAGTSFGGAPVTDTSRARGEQILEGVSRHLPQLEKLELDRVTLGWRPLPADEHPVMGFCPGASDVYLAVMHSGITLAPIVGRLAALEILDGARVELLEPYRVTRFDRQHQP